MQKLNFNINGKHYEATITEVEHNVAEVELNGKKYTIDVERSEAVAIPTIATPKPAAAAAPVAAAPVAANTWKCFCGTENTGKFCAECGAPKPSVPEVWNCKCGNTGITGKFCTECGARKGE